MCGRFVVKINDNFYYRWQADIIEGLESNYNNAPMTPIYTVVKNSPLKIVKMIWGFQPPWAKKFDPKYANINTRAETISIKPFFKSSFLNNRCAIPSTGYYEWKTERKEKTPYYIHMKDNSYFSFAGIYSILEDESGKDIYTCSIITTTPNRLTESIHNRMPVILTKEQENIWLDKDIKDENILKSILKPFKEDNMEAYVVSKRVNNPRNNGEELIKDIHS